MSEKDIRIISIEAGTPKILADGRWCIAFILNQKPSDEFSEAFMRNAPEDTNMASEAIYSKVNPSEEDLSDCRECIDEILDALNEQFRPDPEAEKRKEDDMLKALKNVNKKFKR